MTDPSAQPGKTRIADFSDTQLDLAPHHPVEGGEPKTSGTEQVPGLQDVFEKFKMATEGEKNSGPEASAPVVIASVEVPDPEKTLKNLGDALILIPAFMRPDLKDLYFQSLPGKEVGKSTKEKTIVDPIMLLHPANRLAHVIAHESAHKNLKVPNEGLVEVYLRAIGVVEDGHADAAKTTPKYDKALAGFSDFLGKMAKGGNTDAIAKEVYNLYYKSDYGKIYEMYNRMHVSTIPPAEQDNAVKFFWDVFPELEYDKKGQTQAQSVFEFRKPNFAANPDYKRTYKNKDRV